MPSIIPSPATNLHLYRSLLRECTYLPDSQARAYLRKHVIHSFRRHVPRNPARNKEHHPNPVSIPLPRQLALLRRGRQTLSTLQRANEGHAVPLWNVLSLTYGRKGKRRRELVSALTQADVSTSANHDTAVDVQGNEDEKYKRDWRPPLIVQALMRSQAKHEGEGFGRRAGAGQIKPSPDIAKLNTWGLPMPECRVRNKMRKWYKVNLMRLHPPLPELELQRLRDLADGKIWEGLVTRRSKGTGVDDDVDALKQMGLSAELLVEGPPKSSTFAKEAQGRPHVLTQRYLRRIWQNVLEQVPVTTLEEREGMEDRWKVTWPLQSRARPQIINPTIDQAKILFGE